MMKKLLALFSGFVLLVIAAVIVIGWFSFRIYVPENKCAVLIHKSGKTLPEGEKVARNDDERGVQMVPLGPGRYFYNPLFWGYELHDLVEISSGNPKTWEWVHSLNQSQRDQIRAGKFSFKGEFPEVGVLVRRVGKKAPSAAPVTRDSEYTGILREVLTPGSYKINPYVYEVKKYPAVVIPAGFVGVVTNLFGPAETNVDKAKTPADETSLPDIKTGNGKRTLAERGERGTIKDVLQPGVYFINPKLQKITLIEIGFNEYSQVKVSEVENNRISFPSDTGYDIRVGVTIVWGIDPENAAQIINEVGNIDQVLEIVIGSQLPSICRNIGSTYDARDFIHGEKREMFQRDLTNKLQEVCQAKKIEVLLALVREIEVHTPNADLGDEEVEEDLKRTIQQSYIAIEKQITKEKQREAAVVRAELEEAERKVDIAREQIQAESRVMVANVLADAEKQSAEIDAQTSLKVATVQEEIARLDAQRTEILGQAKADVQKFKKQAEADGYRLLVDAFGSGQAFNLYTFAENFHPKAINLFFAGDGTFWTDLQSIEKLGAAKILKPDKK